MRNLSSIKGGQQKNIPYFLLNIVNVGQTGYGIMNALHTWEMMNVLCKWNMNATHVTRWMHFTDEIYSMCCTFELGENGYLWKIRWLLYQHSNATKFIHNYLSGIFIFKCAWSFNNSRYIFRDNNDYKIGHMKYRNNW